VTNSRLTVAVTGIVTNSRLTVAVTGIVTDSKTEIRTVKLLSGKKGKIISTPSRVFGGGGSGGVASFFN
jgi:DNA-binding cell septation regulator SpoVG